MKAGKTRTKVTLIDDLKQNVSVQNRRINNNQSINKPTAPTVRRTTTPPETNRGNKKTPWNKPGDTKNHPSSQKKLERETPPGGGRRAASLPRRNQLLRKLSLNEYWCGIIFGCLFLLFFLTIFNCSFLNSCLCLA